MKSKLLAVLKILVPLSFGVFLIWLFYDALCEKEKQDLFMAFRKADYFWVGISLLFGFASHLSRAYRWKYMLAPMGYNIKFWNSYHAVMISNFVNLAFPRAGEISRAAIISKTEKIPFQKGFGTVECWVLFLLSRLRYSLISLIFLKVNSNRLVQAIAEIYLFSICLQKL